MKLYEYMGKELFAQFQIPVPQGKVITTAQEAEQVALNLGGPCVLKSQVLSGKRGKAGGIVFADTPQEAKEGAEKLLGQRLGDYTIDMLLVEEKISIEKELYLAITIDSGSRQPILIASTQGGMDIEEVPEEDIIKEPIDVLIGLKSFLAKDIVRRMGFPLLSPIGKELVNIISNMYNLFLSKDAELVEINPLAVCGKKLVAADAKITIDDEALFRQQDLPRVEENTEAEQAARELGLAFVELDGDIAVMANGAGITMGTLDTLAYYGGKPANFLDAGGGTGVEATAKALELLLSRNPKAIVINIFGGITRCDDVARAFATVKANREIPVPVVIRLVGTNQEEGRAILQEAGIEAYDFMQDAIKKAVELAHSS
ncbi:MAG: ADP-forming succinate--CoA ligase subunit beta [Desulfitobacterium sp.]|nr:ADP-forming succinate--CoA ligase subunit beta [Desulfitobacterium sp.]